MSVIIHSTYEVIGEIGSGGGGIVYLARHLNLGKKVVLKADKRKITTRPELLRREVDVLKNLSHTYIPQVYDFFIENETVYTAIDFVEGESLDIPLNRGEKFSQPQVIQWAKQLLEALQYLHEPKHGTPPKGYVHSDIKPANLMRTPDNTIRLIDFNIALALGEENIVGLSAGYASPEHYGIDYTSGGTDDTVKIDTVPDISQTQTQKMSVDTQQTMTQKMVTSINDKSTSGHRKIIPDVRSDIYMVGATLYHLLSGKRPEKDARKVEALSKQEYSPQIVEIIKKAMNPNPDLRYQTATEMLDAFTHLYENDTRTIRHKRQMKIVFSILSFSLICGILTAFIGLKRIQTVERWQNLANSSQEALRQGDLELAVQYAIQAIPIKADILTPNCIAGAQFALTEALGVYDLSNGYKVDKTVILPSEPLYMALSPDGKTLSCIYAYQLTVVDVETGTILDTLPAAESALSEVVYLDKDTLLFAGLTGITRYSIPDHAVIWSGEPATAISLSADGQRAVAIYKDETYAIVYDTKNGKKIYTVDFGKNHQRITVNDSFANPNDNLLALNEDGTMLGVSFSDGSLQLFDLNQSEEPITVIESDNEYTHFEGGFYQQYFSFAADSSDNSIFVVIDTDTGEQTGGFQSESPFSVYANSDGIRVQTDNILVRIDPVTGEQIPLVTTPEGIWRFTDNGTHTLISTKTDFSFYDQNASKMSGFKSNARSDFLELSNEIAVVGSMDSSVLQILHFEEYAEADLFTYDSAYSHSETRVSEDMETVTMFSYSQFITYDKNGFILAEVSIPDAEQVNDQQFLRETSGSYLEVIYNDGKRRRYDVRTGEVIEEYQGKLPDMTLYEEFETEQYRITNPLHGTPEIYALHSGKLLCQLQEDAYLTYATQIGNQLVIQYVTADGYYYGQLLNNQCEVIAQLPYLCDVIDEKLIFDYPAGNIRMSPIYDLTQLVEMTEIQEGV